MAVAVPGNVFVPPLPGTITSPSAVMTTMTTMPPPNAAGMRPMPPNIVAPLLAATTAPPPPMPATIAASPVSTTTTMPRAPVVGVPSPEVGFRLSQAAAGAVEAATRPPPVAAPPPLGVVPGIMQEWQPPVAPPASLTQGIPDPGAIQKQKDDYVRSLDANLRRGAASLEEKTKIQRASMRTAAEEQKKLFMEQIDNQVKMQEMDLDQQFLQVLQHVKQQATRQRAQLEEQAMKLSFEFQEKKVEEDMLAHQFELAKHQQVLRNQMVTSATVSPLPSYLPPTSSILQSSNVQQVPGNPFAQESLRAMVSDALTPPLVHAPLGVRCSTVATSGPPKATPTLSYSATASQYNANIAMPSTVQPTTVVVPTTTTSYSGSATTTMPPPYASPSSYVPSVAPCSVMQPTAAASYSPSMPRSVMSPQAPTAPTVSYVPTVGLSPQPSTATLPVVSYVPNPVLSPQPSSTTIAAVPRA